jgi:acyl-coenzyme A thioesterase PaaI-like protein
VSTRLEELKGSHGLAQACHAACIACGAGKGLELDFCRQPDGSVTAIFACADRYQSYADCLHGGVIATLLDSAMTHCLFAQGVAGVTARLAVNFREPVHLNEPAEVSARVTRQNKVIYTLRAELHQSGIIKAWAEGKFVPRTERAPGLVNPCSQTRYQDSTKAQL